jgi:hypothetical protein
MNTKLCKCGCGQSVVITRYGKENDYITGHNTRGKRKVKWSQFVCKHCGNAFEDLPHRGARTFCSAQCRDEYRRLQRGKQHAQYKDRVAASCFVCGKSIMVLPSRVSKTTRISCSPECGHKIRLSVIKDIKRNGYGKKAAMVRDGNKCVLCGFDFVVAVHHITPKRKGGTDRLTNLVCLCPNHHYMAHAGLLKDADLMTFAVDYQLSANDREALSQRHIVNFRKDTTTEIE